jgi:hypothetical protein
MVGGSEIGVEIKGFLLHTAGKNMLLPVRSQRQAEAEQPPYLLPALTHHSPIEKTRVSAPVSADLGNLLKQTGF